MNPEVIGKKGEGREDLQQPAGSPMVGGNTGYSPAAGLTPDTLAPGTRKSNTYKSGRTGGEYMRVLKPDDRNTQIHK